MLEFWRMVSPRIAGIPGGRLLFEPGPTRIPISGSAASTSSVTITGASTFARFITQPV